MKSPHFRTPEAHPLPPSATESFWLRASLLGAGTAFSLAAALPGALERGLSVSVAPACAAPWLMLLGLRLPTTGLSQLMLLVVAPVLVVLSLAWPGVGAPSAPAMGMLAVAWLVYAALALQQVRPASTWEITQHPVRDTVPKEPVRVHVSRRIYWATLALGTGLLALVMPLVGSDAVYRAAWGEAAPAARVLVAVAAGSVSVVAVAAIVTPALRRQAVSSTATPRRTIIRALLYVLAAIAFAGIAWAITRARV